MGCFLKGAWRKLRNKPKRRSKENLRPISPECVDESSTKCSESNKDSAPVSHTMPPTSDSPVAPCSETTTDDATRNAPPNSTPKPALHTEHSDIWHKGYAKFVERETDLADDYRKHLAADSAFLGPDEAKAVVGRLQEERQAKQWKFTFYGKDVKFRAQVEKLAKALVWCDRFVKGALSTQPHAALAWSAVSICLPLLSNASARHAAMISGFDSVQRVIVYWKIYQDTFPEDFNAGNNADAQNVLVDLYSRIFEFQARVICHLSRAQLSRAWQKVAGWNEWETKASHIDTLSDNCKGCTDISRSHKAQKKCDKELEEMFESRKALQGIHRILEEASKQRLNDRVDDLERNLLENLAAEYDFYKNFNLLKVEGTCGWLLEDPSFCTWRDRTDSGLLLLFAGPGYGKSVLTRSLIDDWQLTTSATTSMVCHFFFKDGDTKRMHSHDALAAILHQVFIQDLTGKFLETALDRHKKYGDKLAENFDQLWDILLDCAFTPDAGEIICALDAFDECLKDERDRLITKLQEFYSTNGAASQRNCRLKFLITSRPYDIIVNPLRQLLSTSCLQIDGGDHSAAISKDIDRVIDNEIPKLLSKLSENEQERVSQQLKDMENRTYLWLRLTFDIIKNNPSEYGRLTDVNGLIQKLPNDHAGAYEMMLKKNGQNKFARPLLQILLAARRPLSLDEVNLALALAVENSPDVQSIPLWPKKSFAGTVKNFCGLLVDIQDSKVHFLHQTVREFLVESPQQDGKDWEWRGQFHAHEYHNTMARWCIRYLSLPDLEPPLDSPEDLKDFPGTIFHYAARYWAFHYQASREVIDTELLHKAGDLCHAEGRNLSWLRVNESFGSWRGRPALLIATWFGLDKVVGALLENGPIDINAADHFFGTALQMACSIRKAATVVAVLLDHGADVTTRSDDPTPIDIAIMTRNYDAFRLILERRANEVEVTMDLVIRAAGAFTQQEVEALFPLKDWQHKLALTPDILTKACEDERDPTELAFLFKHWDKEIEITPDLLHAAARNRWNGPRVMRIFIEELEKRQVQIKVNEEILVAVAENREGHQILSLLLSSERIEAEDKVTSRVVVAAVGNAYAGIHIMGVLLEMKLDHIRSTPDIVSAAKGNKRHGKWILELIELSRQEGKDQKLILQEIGARKAQILQAEPWKKT